MSGFYVTVLSHRFACCKFVCVQRERTMAGVSEIPIVYMSVSVVCSGFLLYALAYYVYVRLIIKNKALTPFVVICSAALVYTLADIFMISFAIFKQSFALVVPLRLLRELSMLLSVVAFPSIVSYGVVLHNKTKRLHGVISAAVSGTALVVVFLSLIMPQMLIGDGAGLSAVSQNGFPGGVALGRQPAPLMLLKGVISMFAVLYTTIVLFFASMRKLYRYPIKKLLAAFALLLYFLFTAIFDYFFLNPGAGSMYYSYPHVSVGVCFFILLCSLEMADIFHSRSRELQLIKKDLDKTPYLDARLQLPNRSGFSADLEKHLSSIIPGGPGDGFYLLFIDIDDFGHVNESFGEIVCDTILSGFVSRLREQFGKSGKLYRIGGDDFVLWADDSFSGAQVETLAGRMITSLRNPFVINAVSYIISVSIGIIHVPRDGDDSEMIFSNGYRVMNSAKRSKNCYRVFNKDMVDSVANKIQLVNILRKSIAADRFELYYQPVVGIDETIVYAEALLRCTDPDPSIGGPGRFIPVLERAGLMKEVDDMVIRKAFYDMENHIGHICNISINLSSNQLLNPSYCNFIAAFASQHRISPEQVILEIVEDVLIGNFRLGRENILRLKQKGFKIAIDDFGKGFSSLSYLAELPVDILKVDRAFVSAVPGDAKSESIAASIVALAHSLDLIVVAEGFEKIEQIEFFRKQGCDNYQGYYFSRPLPLQSFLEKYRNY